jgi:hypothetical protein
MRKYVKPTPIHEITLVAYFGIKGFFIFHTCWLAKESRPLIYICRDRDLTPEGECCLVKNYQPLMVKESAAKEEGVPNWPHGHGL